MKSKNFEFLNEVSWKDEYEILSDIEDRIDQDIILNEINELLKSVLMKSLSNGGYIIHSDENLSQLIKMFRNMVEEKLSRKNQFNNRINQNVLEAMYLIQKSRNNRIHSAVDKYKLFISPIDKINFLRAINVVLRYIIAEYYDKKITHTKFDENIYYKVLGLVNPRPIEDEKYKFNNGQIQISDLKMGNFVLDSNNHFVIPEYQREYTWDADSCEDLLIDIFEKSVLDDNSSNVYFGSIAIMTKNDLDEKEFDIKVIDGQQRITTSLIFFAAVHDYLSVLQDEHDNFDFEMPSWLEDFFSEESNAFKKIRNFSVESSKDPNFNVLTMLLNSKKRIELENKIDYLPYRGQSRVYANYKAIWNFLKKRNSIENVIKMADFFYNNFIISQVNFNQESSNEMEIFENLNSKGKDLTTFDVIKNHIFNLIQPDVFSNNSKDIVRIFHDYLEFNDEEKEFLRKGSKKDHDFSKEYVDFFHNFITYKRREIIKKDKKIILKKLKLVLGSDRKTLDEYKDICHSVGKYFKIYKDVSSFINIMKTSNDWRNTIFESIQNLKQKDITVLSFYLYDMFGVEWNILTKQLAIKEAFKEEFRKSFFEIERWILFLIQVSGTGQSLTSVYINLLQYLDQKMRLFPLDEIDNFKKSIPILMRNWFEDKLENHEYQDARVPKIGESYKMPTLARIQDSMLNGSIKQDVISLAFLRRIELSLINTSNENLDQRLTRLKKTTIEHIMPRSLKKWVNEFEGMNQLDIEIQHDQYLNYLGNLMILSNSKNAAASDNVFIEKVKIYKAENNVFITQNYAENPDDFKTIETTKKWTFDEIKERNRKLTNIILSIYQI